MSNSKYFDKTVMPACKYCEHCREINGGTEFFCVKCGFVDGNDQCRSYKYDILKREPDVVSVPRNHKKEDFMI